MTANIPAVADPTPSARPIEYRLYAWGATSATGGTHVNLASLNARFVAVPTLEFNFAGVQDNAPLTRFAAQTRTCADCGLNFGPGVAPRVATDNAGNEFHVAGFSTGSTLQSALAGDDYLSFRSSPSLAWRCIPTA